MDYRKTVGRIFDIQKFSVHDGPGIRTIIFFKGCPLRCRWCCNPEGQRYNCEEMRMDDGTVRKIGRDVTAGEVTDELMKDYAYYRRSGGGVTLSGGEMLMQADFAEAILRLCKDYGISTAVETTGYADFNIISRLIPHIDCFLMDIKHINKEKHREYTGRDNEPILKNAAEIARRAKRFVIRVPVIPGFNDKIDEISDIAGFVTSLEGVGEINLLPYHRMGSDKYRWLGRSYTLSELSPPTDEHMQLLKKTVEKRGLLCKIGG